MRVEKHRVIPTLLLYFVIFLTNIVWDAFTAETFNTNEWISNIGAIFTVAFLHMGFTLIVLLVQDNSPWFGSQHNHFHTVEGDAVVGKQNNEQ